MKISSICIILAALCLAGVCASSAPTFYVFAFLGVFFCCLANILDRKNL